MIYSVADVAAGTPDTLYLQARSVSTPATENSGFADMTVVKASLAVTKEAYRDDQTTLITGPVTVLPNEFIWYKVIITNSGTAPASSVHVDDLLPSDVTYVSSAEDAPTWTIVESSGDVDADLTGTLAGGGGSRFFWIRVSVN